MRSLLPLLVALCLMPYLGQAIITLPKIVKSGMVLQQEPQLAQVWGWSDDTVNPLTVNVLCDTGYAGNANGVVADGRFTAAIGPVPGGEICTIDITQGDQTVTLTNVLFGDVWVCSGQSNMEWGMNSIFNSGEEIANSAGFTNIRMFNIASVTSATAQEDLPDGSWDSWSDPSDAGRLGGFSAVCFIYAREISQRWPNRFFGLVGSNWGGTRIEPWSPPEALTNCGVTLAGGDIEIYNYMIHPLHKMTIGGALWYQGESNQGHNRDLYSCTFSEMINTWRARWAASSGSNPMFPFGFAQLASNRAGYNGYECPIIRWHQSMDVGHVPHEQMQNVFMAVTLDTHDPEGGIHPRDKQTVGRRLAIAGLNVAYGQTQYPTNGPYFTSIEVGADFAHINYDMDFTYNTVENSGFYVCTAAAFGECENNGNWVLIDQSQVSQMGSNGVHVMLPANAVGLAYLWNESPLMVPLGAPIYAPDEYALPAAPWKFDLTA